MKEVHDTVEKLFWWKLKHHFTLAGLWWSTHKNFRADGITRTELDSDWRLNNSVFLQLWAAWGPFDMDLMASSISVQNRPDGSELPFFSRYISPRASSDGVCPWSAARLYQRAATVSSGSTARSAAGGAGGAAPAGGGPPR